MRRPPSSTRGYSLMELLVAITMVALIAAAASSMFQSQSRAHRANTDRYDLIQNVRGAIEGTERVIRTMGAGTPGGQPMLVYGAGTVLAFSADYVERDTVDMRWAAYFDENTPVAESAAWLQAAATTVPNSSPSYTYPSTTYRLGNGALSPAETYMFYFVLDATTARTDDYVLWQRVNDGTPEVLARNILPHPSGRPFFQYIMARTLVSGDTLVTASGGELPLIRRELVAGITPADSASYVRPDSVRAVRINLRLTNGRLAADYRFRDVSTTVEVPNNGVQLPTVCGRPPYAPAGVVAVDTVPGSGRIWLTWNASADQGGGEQDVRQYIVWRRLTAASAFAEPLLVVRAESLATYTTEISGNVPGTSYTFGVAAQDCTPSQSTVVTTAVTPTLP